ncbi:citryl-CoA lyase [Actinomadura graeca]|uniref:citrate synthase (unknown stereospecificity) n=1 Tax=Actinomadura graeca TaxID=2750812 RepID=A0ABX8QRN0_9ACTN|nr:citryl-CoA lyase [Actinomadura graeca]QXJ21086.1 citryl-CoA lyase [Actinomadura graeca]
MDDSTTGPLPAGDLVLRGHALVDELMGVRTLSEVTYLHLAGRLPTVAQAAVFDAMLVALIDHGMTASVLVSKLTAFGAPNALQGAVAAGLLGVGDRLVGSIENAAYLLDDLLSAAPTGAALEDIAEAAVEAASAEGRILPGIGHRFYKSLDPRAGRLFTIAQENDLDGPYVDLVRMLSESASRRHGRPLVVNVTGAIGALVNEVGLPWQAGRGLGLISRTVGLVGRLLDPDGVPIAEVLAAAQARPSR